MKHTSQVSCLVVDRSGVTLLEVLIAGGILVVGLAGIASILPAAGLILGEAVTADRAAALANNAFAEIARQGTFRAADFGIGGSGNATTTVPVRTVVCGDMFTAPSGRLDYPFPIGPISATNNLTFSRKASIVPTGADQTTYGVLWFGATATPLAEWFPPSAALPPPQPPRLGLVLPGSPARVTVVVVRGRAPERDRVALQQFDPPPLGDPIPGVYRVMASPPARIVLPTPAPAPSLIPPEPTPGIPPTPASPPAYAQGSTILREDIRKRLLEGCSWVMVVDRFSGTVSWVRISSSWVTAAQEHFVSFVDSTTVDAVAAKDPSNRLEVYAFQGIVRVEERIIQLAE